MAVLWGGGGDARRGRGVNNEKLPAQIHCLFDWAPPPNLHNYYFVNLLTAFYDPVYPTNQSEGRQ